MSIQLFTVGILLGMLAVYAMTLAVKFLDYEQPEEVVTEMPEEEPVHIQFTTEEMDAWYNSVMEIFSAKE